MAINDSTTWRTRFVCKHCTTQPTLSDWKLELGLEDAKMDTSTLKFDCLWKGNSESLPAFKGKLS